MGRWMSKARPVDAFLWTGGQDQTEDPEWFNRLLEEDKALILGPGSSAVSLLLRGMPTPVRPPLWVVKDGSKVRGFSEEEFHERFMPVFVSVEEGDGHEEHR